MLNLIKNRNICCVFFRKKKLDRLQHWGFTTFQQNLPQSMINQQKKKNTKCKYPNPKLNCWCRIFKWNRISIKNFTKIFFCLIYWSTAINKFSAYYVIQIFWLMYGWMCEIDFFFFLLLLMLLMLGVGL